MSSWQEQRRYNNWLVVYGQPNALLSVVSLLGGRNIQKYKTGQCIFLFKPNSEFCQVHMLYSVCLVVHVTFKIRGHLLILAQNATWTYSHSHSAFETVFYKQQKKFFQDAAGLVSHFI